MTKRMIKPGERQGLLTLRYTEQGRMHFTCECGDLYELAYRQRNSFVYGTHCGCLDPHGKNGKIQPKGWTEFYKHDQILRTWCAFPKEDKCPYYDLVKAYSGIHSPTGAPLPPPSRMALRDPSKPATFDNIEVFFIVYAGDRAVEVPFDEFSPNFIRTDR